MKKILLTGGTGFIGRNILPILRERYVVDAPSRKELNILDIKNVEEYLKINHYDVVLHFANTNPVKNSLDKSETFFKDSIDAYFNFARCSKYYGKMFYLGSGAEFDKRFDITNFDENQIGKSIPVDEYGLAKYIMNQDARDSENIYNLRIFGCYGKTDAKTKFIRDCIDCCLENRPITIRQNCLFDYMYVEDLAKIISYFIENEPKYHDYNICTGKKISLVEIAQIVKEKLKNPYDIQIAKEGFNREYTADNKRLCSEMPDVNFTSIEKGIEEQIKWQIEMFEGIHV